MLLVVGKYENNSCWIYYSRYTKRSCRAGSHNTYPSRLGVPNDGGIQPHYHSRIDGFQLPVSFPWRPRYRSNQRWKYNTVASITTTVKVGMVKSQFVVVSGLILRLSIWCCQRHMVSLREVFSNPWRKGFRSRCRRGRKKSCQHPVRNSYQIGCTSFAQLCYERFQAACHSLWWFNAPY
jgi:hypothetical protein